MNEMKPTRVGMVGSGYVARAHTLAYNNATLFRWPDLAPVERRRIADVSMEFATRGAERLGWEDAVDDWHLVTRGEDIDLVDIVTPNDTHAEIAIDAAENGKHIFCEKPMAIDGRTALAMTEAAHRAGVVNQVCFSYRAWPGVRFARRMIEEGKLGKIVHFRAWFLQDYALDATLPMVWRLQRDKAGSGKLGDGGSHLIDLARFLVGEVDQVFGHLNTFIKERPRAVDTGEAVFTSDGGSTEAELVPVDVEDSADVLLRFENGATGLIQTSWVAAGHKLDLGFEIGGELGALRLSWQRGNEIEYFSRADEDETAGFRVLPLGPSHPGYADFWKIAGQGLGMSDAFLLAVGDVLQAVQDGRSAPGSPDFLDGLRACEIVDAALRSGEEESWVAVERSLVPERA